MRSALRHRAPMSKSEILENKTKKKNEKKVEKFEEPPDAI